ncbi:MAG TPA: hypothetical protein VHE35_32010 [Kofleriaceae bacterium]|nr:hypothetical protein [Kofleriaceae bacterium]
MKTLQRAALVLAAALALAACGGKAQPPTTPEPSPDDPVATMNYLRDQLCACKDQDCAAPIGDKINAASARYQSAKVTDEQLRSINEANAGIDTCMKRLMNPEEDERISVPQ